MSSVACHANLRLANGIDGPAATTGVPTPGAHDDLPRTVARTEPRPVTLRSMVHAFVLIDAAPARVADLAVELAEVDGVAEVYSVAGHADIVAVVRVRQHEELAKVVTRGIGQLPGITNTRTLIAFQAYSRHDLEAIWDIGAV
jgi:DNA-binding Lrp family transcriptional regulator